MEKVITISRQFGSGGREFGIKLAKALGIPFYDKDLITKAAEESNLSADFMRHYEESACVIIGRCSDVIVEDSIKIYVHAPLEKRIERKLAMDIGVPAEKMADHIRATDKKRKKYYEYYTDQKWGMAENHHLCLDSGIVGIDGCVETALEYISKIQ